MYLWKQLNGHLNVLNVFIVIAEYLQCLLLSHFSSLVTTKLLTCNLFSFLSENALKLTYDNVELQQFSRVKPRTAVSGGGYNARGDLPPGFRGDGRPWIDVIGLLPTFHFSNLMENKNSASLCYISVSGH